MRTRLFVGVSATMWFAGCACGGAPFEFADAGAPDSHADATAMDVDTPALADTPTFPEDAAETAPDARRDPDAGSADDATRFDSARIDGPPPIVLAHGFFGFDELGGLDSVRYFHRVRDELAAHGEASVYTPAVDPFASSEVRGRQLASAIEAIRSETGSARVHLIAHSQGGLDARVVADLHPEWLASITTISTPHGGTRAADVLLRIVRDDRLRDLADAFVRLVGGPLYTADGAETSVFAAIRQFSQPEIAAFDRRHPARVDIPFFSIAGRSSSQYAPLACRASDRPGFITRWDPYLDPVDPILAVPAAVVDERLIAPVPNDGLVAVESARWGRFLGCIPADHIDEVGHFFGDRAGLLNPFDHLDFYRGLVAWLRAELD